MFIPKVLLVDDSPPILKVLTANLKENNFDVITCESGQQALSILEQESEINVIITDLLMDGMQGGELFEITNQNYPDIPVIILTGYGTIESAVELVKKGAYDYLEKPSNNYQLIKLLNKAAKQNRLQRENNFLRQELYHKKSFCNILGRSNVMLKLFDLIKVSAVNDFSVLIEGESGTGKELVAKAIFQKSKKKDVPFVIINCGNIPSNLIESELFGHEKGAFTGASSTRIGKFEQAHNGTIFLDEIGELDLALQTRLLRVLQEKVIQRVGGNTDIKVNFRLISATNRNLKKAVQEKQFREDLYYRINVFKIEVPPLRKRKEDILLLANNFIGKHSIIPQNEPKEISAKILSILQDYHWPGNVRQLENVILGALALSHTSKTIKKSHLPKEIIEATQVNTKKKQSEKKNEKQIIIKALQKANNNKTKAAEILEMKRRTLYRKLEKYQIK